MAVLSSFVSSGPASSIRARYSYWPTTLGTIRKVVRFRIPSSPRATRWLTSGSQSPALTFCSRIRLASASRRPRASTVDAQGHRVAGEDDRAGLDLGDADVPRPFLGPGGDGVDRDVQPRRGLGDAEGVFPRVRPPVRHQHDPGDRPPPVRGEHPAEGVAERRDRPRRVDRRQRPRRRRPRGAGLARRFEVVQEDVAPGAELGHLRPERRLDQVDPRHPPEAIHGRLPRLRPELQGRGELGRLAVVGVRVGEPHALRVVDDHRQVRLDRLALRRDQDRLDQHRRDRQEHQRPQADQDRPPLAGQLVLLAAGEPPEQDSAATASARSPSARLPPGSAVSSSREPPGSGSPAAGRSQD